MSNMLVNVVNMMTLVDMVKAVKAVVKVGVKALVVFGFANISNNSKIKNQ